MELRSIRQKEPRAQIGEDFRQGILQLLNTDPEVQEAVRRICQPLALPDDSEQQQAMKRRIQELQQDLQDKQSQISDYENTLRAQAGVIQKLQADKQKLSQEISQLQESRKEQASMEHTVSSLREQLQSRFQEAYDCFKKYQDLDLAEKSRLGGVIKRPNDFESFVCCLSQVDALEQLWDEWQYYVLNHKDGTALEALFRCAMRLVNKTLRQDIFVNLEDPVGKVYNVDTMSLVPNSSNQGTVKKVWLLGFKNSYRNKIIRSSLVEL